MKKYPRLYRLSTVNLIYHRDCDFDLDPFRTDFTGNGGVGKSLIADLLQLIFVGSTEFESATDSGGARFVRTMVAKSSDTSFDFGYAVLSIEKSPNQFIGIGVYIQNNIDQAKNFIVQKSQKFDEKSILETFDEPLSYKDFIIDSDNAVRPLDINAHENCKESLLEIRQLVIEDLGHERYFKILANNDILPLKVKEYRKSVQIYRNIIKTFARGSKISFDKDEPLKDFLFGSDDKSKIWKDYETTSSSLKDSISRHQTTLEDISGITKKLSDLNNLLIKKEIKETKNVEWLKANLGFCKYQYEDAENKFKESTNSVLDSFKKLKTFKTFLETQDTLFSETQKGLGSKVSLFPLIQDKSNKIEKVEKWFNHYNITSTNELKTVFATQLVNRNIATQIKELERQLNDFEIYGLFQKSDWAKGYSEGLDQNNSIIKDLEEQILHKEALEAFSDLKNKNSLAYWAVNRNNPLSHIEASVLLHFQKLSIQKPLNPKKFTQYLPSPNSFFGDLLIKEESDKGFWLNLGGIHEFIELVSEPFDFSKIIENIGQWNDFLKKDIDALKIKLGEWEKLKEKITTIDAASINVYKSKEQVKNYAYNLELDILESDFLQTLESYSEKEKIRNDYEEWNGLNAKKITVENNLKIIIKVTALIDSNLELYEQYKDIWTNSNLKIESQSEIIADFEINPDKWEEIYKLCKPISVELYKQKYDLWYQKQQEYKDALDLIKHNPLIIESEINNIESEPLILSEEMKDSKLKYEAKYISVAEYLSESEREKILDGSYSFINLGIELLPEILRDESIFSDKEVVSIVNDKLKRIQEQSREFTRNKIKSLKGILNSLKETIENYKSLHGEIESFFREQKKNDNLISGEFEAKLRWKTGIIDTKWLSDFTLEIEKNWNTLLINADFQELLSNKITLDDFTLTIFNKLTNSNRTKNIKEILDPRNYFKLEFEMSNDDYINTGISNSQSYSAVALLCIARLSVIEKQRKGNTGIRFMPIDEAESLGSNFDMLYNIAKDKDYQIITMSIAPIISLEEINRTVYVLRRNTEEKGVRVNHTPKKMSNKLIDEENDTNEMEVPKGVE